MNSVRENDLIRHWLIRHLASMGVVGVLLCLPPDAHAQFTAGHLLPTVTTGYTVGNGNNNNVDIAELQLALGHYYRDNLAFLTELTLYRPTGTRDGSSANTLALGLSFGLRWHFVRRSSYSVYVDWGMGGMGALDRFPPAGTRFNGTPHFGLGVSVRAKDDWHLLAGVRQLHMSNGRGLVEDNPSFDGLGAYAGIAARPGSKRPIPAIGENLAYGGRPIRLRLDARIERGDDDNSPVGTAAVDAALHRDAHLFAQLAASLGELVDEDIWEVAVHVYRETPNGRIAVGYARKEFNVFTSDFYNVQLARTLNDVSTLEVLTSLEHRNLDEDRIFGGVFITSYPADMIAIRSGIGFERQQDEFLNSLKNLNDAGFTLAVECAPKPLAAIGISAFANVGIGYDTDTFGIRFRPGGGSSVRAMHRGGSLIPLR